MNGKEDDKRPHLPANYLGLRYSTLDSLNREALADDVVEKQMNYMAELFEYSFGFTNNGFADRSEVISALYESTNHPEDFVLLTNSGVSAVLNTIKSNPNSIRLINDTYTDRLKAVKTQTATSGGYVLLEANTSAFSGIKNLIENSKDDKHSNALV
jgi:hypothetical protein